MEKHRKVTEVSDAVSTLIYLCLKKTKSKKEKKRKERTSQKPPNETSFRTPRPPCAQLETHLRRRSFAVGQKLPPDHLLLLPEAEPLL